MARGVWKAWFQQSTSTHSGAGDKKTFNINVVGKTRLALCCFTYKLHMKAARKKVQHLSSNIWVHMNERRLGLSYPFSTYEYIWMDEKQGWQYAVLHISYIWKQHARTAEPAINLYTLRGRRKGDPQHKCYGENVMKSFTKWWCPCDDGLVMIMLEYKTRT